jgi:hypothetical protein
MLIELSSGWVYLLVEEKSHGRMIYVEFDQLYVWDVKVETTRVAKCWFDIILMQYADDLPKDSRSTFDIIVPIHCKPDYASWVCG